MEAAEVQTLFDNMISEDREVGVMLEEIDLNRTSKYSNVVMNPVYLGNFSVDCLPPTLTTNILPPIIHTMYLYPIRDCYAYGMSFGDVPSLAIPTIPERSDNYRDGSEVNTILHSTDSIQFPIVANDSNANHRRSEHYELYGFTVRDRINKIGEERNFLPNNSQLSINMKLPIYSSIRVTIRTGIQHCLTTYLYLGKRGHKSTKSVIGTKGDYSLRKIITEYTPKANN